VAHDAKHTCWGQATLKRAEAHASKAQRVAEMAGLRAPRPGSPPEAVQPLRERGRVGRGFRAAAGRRRRLFHEADFIRRQAIEGIDLRVHLPLQARSVCGGVRLLGFQDAVHQDHQRVVLCPLRLVRKVDRTDGKRFNELSAISIVATTKWGADLLKQMVKQARV